MGMNEFFEKLKNYKKNIVDLNTIVASKFVKFLNRFPFLTPNIITIIAFIVAGIIGSIFILKKFYTIASFIILFGFWLDSVDGNFARNNGMVTKEGAILDSVLDRYSDLFILSAIIISSPKYLIIGLLAIIGSTMVPYIRARIEGIGKKAPGTFASREIRCVIIIIGLMFHQIFLMLFILAVLTNISALHRLYNGIIKKDI